MTSATMTDAEVGAVGWQALVAKLGAAGALRFAMQTERGYGDYAEARHRMLGSLGADELLRQMRGRRGAQREARGHRRPPSSR